MQRRTAWMGQFRSKLILSCWHWRFHTSGNDSWSSSMLDLPRIWRFGSTRLSVFIAATVFLLRATEIDLHFSVTSVLSFPRGNGKKEPGKKEPHIVFSRQRREIFWIFNPLASRYRKFRYFWFWDFRFPQLRRFLFFVRPSSLSPPAWHAEIKINFGRP